LQRVAGLLRKGAYRMKITDGLMAEHTMFLSVFDHVERLLPRLTTPKEVATMAGLVESLLKGHADSETNLAYLALDHALAEQGHIERMYQDHHEIDARLKAVQTARTCDEGRRLLQAALQASRDHFRAEERIVFPMIEKLLHAETLAELGGVWLHGPINSLERFERSGTPNTVRL
jgi:hemerythrin-like domain-containing protein